MNPQKIISRFLPVLHSEASFVVVGKPAGFDVPSGGAGPADGADLLLGKLGLEEWHVVMPVESQLSGPVILARTSGAARQLAGAMQGPRTRVEYVAVVEGKPTRPRPGGKERPKGGAPVLRPRMIRQRGQRTLTEFRHDGPRTAAVRADLKAIGLTVLGDVKPSRHRAPKLRPGRIFLHRTLLQFQHPETGKTVAIRQPAPPVFEEALGEKPLPEDLLAVALGSRLPLLADEGTDCYRLFGGKSEGLSGLTFERLGPVGVIQTLPGKMQADVGQVRDVAKWYGRTFGLQAVYHKSFVRDRSKTEAADDALFSSRPLVGKPAAEELAVRENGITYLIRPYDGYSTGLFLDQRDNRRRLASLAKGGRVLNTFAYTCGFSVACALGGAAETVNVDISRRYLDWGKRNFAANGLDPEKHHFVCEDIFDYLARADRKQREFDLIILDPPSFARTKKPRRVFSVVDDLQRMIAASVAVLTPGGHLFCSTNNRTRSAGWLRDQLGEACVAAHRRARVVATPALPLDYASDPPFAASILACVR
jgi:23S rRNA (cytosine1962-C5)-methyltransferase